MRHEQVRRKCGNIKSVRQKAPPDKLLGKQPYDAKALCGCFLRYRLRTYIFKLNTPSYWNYFNHASFNNKAIRMRQIRWIYRGHGQRFFHKLTQELRRQFNGPSLTNKGWPAFCIPDGAQFWNRICSPVIRGYRTSSMPSRSVRYISTALI